MHLQVVATILGPLHDRAYVVTIVSAAMLARPACGLVLLALIPGVGGTLAAAVLRRWTSVYGAGS